MNHNSYWNWTTEGLGGVLGMMEQLLRDKAPVTVEQLDKLMKASKRLEGIALEAMNRVENQ